MIYATAILSPLVGCLLAGIFGRTLGDRFAFTVTIGFMLLAAVCAESSLAQVLFADPQPDPVVLGTWFDIGGFRLDWALRRDTLSSVMVAMVAPVATLIHVYSVGYMAHERRSFRFFAYLSLFTFAMLMLVSANNLVQLFFGWEGVGLASYLLIGYWYDRPSANRAAMKAFIVNRVGDLFFAVGIALVFSLFGSVEFPVIFAHVADHTDALYHVLGHTWRAYEVIGFLLFIGAMGKSAQIGLHTWLPDAMEGPTPVSALIHAATMVTAGVFLMARMSWIMESAQGALTFVMFIGATTCIFAATVACVQTDIKRVIAYSTCSQLGYMFMAAGAGAYQASIFHLITHAFFKALLFLCAGSVIHAMSDEQDMRKMGGIWRMVPVTYACMWLGSLAIAGVPFFAGYWSKDAILEAAVRIPYRHGRIRLHHGRGRRVPDGVLLLAADHHDVPRRAAGEPPHHGARAREHPLDDGAADDPGGRRGVRRLGAARLVHRRRAGRVLGRVDPCRHQQPYPAGYRARAAVHLPAADRHRRGGHRARLRHVHACAGPAGAAGDDLPADLPVPAAQMVFRRAVRLPVRAPGAEPGPAAVACRRREADRRHAERVPQRWRRADPPRW